MISLVKYEFLQTGAVLHELAVASGRRVSWRALISARLASCFRSDHDSSPWRAGVFAVASKVRMSPFVPNSENIALVLYPPVIPVRLQLYD